MRNYRFDTESSSTSDAGNIASTSRAQAPNEAYLQYIEAYENHHADGEVSFTEQTIDDEYKTYVAGAPNLKRQATSKLVDPLKFWEVSIHLIHLKFLTIQC
jgi:hypothetical protein